MNTPLKVTIVAVAVVAVLAMLGVGFAFAQGMSPWGAGYGMTGNNGFANQDGTPAPGAGYGMMGNAGMMGNGTGTTLAPARSAGVNGQGSMMSGMGMMSGQRGMGMMNAMDMNTMHQWMSTSGGMHNVVWGGLADALGLSQDDLSAQLAGGQSLTQIAEAQGLTQAELAAALETSVKAGLDQVVADGVLTQAQADQMLNHMAGRYDWMLTQMGAGMGVGPGNCHENVAAQSNS